MEDAIFMKKAEMKSDCQLDHQFGEVIQIDGCKIFLHFARSEQSDVLANIKKMLIESQPT